MYMSIDLRRGGLVTDRGSATIPALEATWAAIQARHADVPGVVMVTGSGHAQKGVTRWGHHCPDQWMLAQPDDDGAASGGKAGELFIAGELLAYGGRRILETV